MGAGTSFDHRSGRADFVLSELKSMSCTYSKSGNSGKIADTQGTRPRSIMLIKTRNGRFYDIGMVSINLGIGQQCFY